MGRNAEHYLYEMLEKELLIYLPVELARGMSLEDATVIFDECQNADIHTMKTIVSRVASSSKLICLGDLGQIDAPFKKNEVLGKLTIIIEGKPNIEVDLVAETDVNQINPILKIFAAIKYLIFGTSLDE